MKKQKKNETLGVEQIKSLIRGMMVTSPTPWTIQEKTGDIIDNNGRFVARVGWGIEKFKHPVDQNNRELILKAVQFYMEQKELEARKAKAEEKSENLPKVIHDGLVQVENPPKSDIKFVLPEDDHKFVVVPPESRIPITEPIKKDEPTALAFTPNMTEDGIIEDVPPIQGTDEARVDFMKKQLGH